MRPPRSNGSVGFVGRGSLVEAQRARERKVELGLITEDLAQVVSGLEAGTPVVVSGQETLDDDVGVIVNVRE